MQSPEGLRRAASQSVMRPQQPEPEEHEADPTEHIHLPPPTIWPVTTAFGVAVAGLGLVTVEPISIVGLLIMFWGIYSWIQELRHELH
jgi:hypothetical protein